MAEKRKRKLIYKNIYFWIITGGVFFIIIFYSTDLNNLLIQNVSYKSTDVAPIAPSKIVEVKKEIVPTVAPLDKDLYDKKMKELANVPLPKEPKPVVVTKKVVDKKTGKTTLEKTTVPGKPVVVKPSPWPATAVYPNAGAILPFSRIVAYYGNLYSKKMGALGEYSPDVMLAKLDAEAKKWEKADPSTPVIQALHYITVTAQNDAGTDGKYRARMPSSEIDKVLKMAEKSHAIVFLDVQVGLSNLQAELPLLEKYLKLPNVHLGIDPEFSMKDGTKPGHKVGTFDAADINYASEFLARIVKENNLTPKVFIVHRWTQNMVTNYKNIKTFPEVQIVMDMDGWGGQAKKFSTYNSFIYPEPVQFTGFKLFYKNDIKTPGTTLLTPEQILKLSPRPIYIQYQ